MPRDASSDDNPWADPGSDRSQELEQLVFEAIERRAQGGAEALERWLSEHGGRAGEVRAELERLARIGLLPGSPAVASCFPERLGDFRLIERLGAGGMGVVYAAEQVSLGRPVARLQHPGIVPVYTVGEEQGLPYFAMERLDGCTLADVLRALAGRDPASLAGADLARAVQPDAPGRGAMFEGAWIDACLRLARDLAEALEHAHSRGVVHRDVKPSNVALTRSGRAMLLDFGLALSGGEDQRLTRSGFLAGSLAYMSPEQLEGRSDLDGRTDVWSLGVTLYELLTLSQPFEGGTQETTRERILRGEFPRPRAHNARLAADVETVVLAAMERDRARRYATAGDLARDLGNLLARRPIEARRLGLSLRILRWGQRHPRATAAWLAAVPLALAALGAIAWIQSERSRTEGGLRQEAQKSAALASERERDAIEERAKVLRLADLKRLTLLEDEAAGLFPVRPERLGDMGAWLGRARQLVERRALHEQALAELMPRAMPEPSNEPRFASTEDAWQYENLIELLDSLRKLEDPEQGLIADLESRRSKALELEERTVESDLARQWWELAIASIGDEGQCPAYAGLELAVQFGLLPIGRDSRSGLWEFAHLLSGAVPERGPEGRWQLDDASCLILVLVPGGMALIGSQSQDPDAPCWDPTAHIDEAPVREVELDPFFLAKYELSQAQWTRLMGSNPSFFRTPVWRNVPPRAPVEQVSWDDCAEFLKRADLQFPTAGQWEFAARAGTTTAWWTGSTKESLRGAVNLADASTLRAGVPFAGMCDDPDLDDGYVNTAPVDAFRPNPYGLYNVHGNVWEWCLEGMGSRGRSLTPGDGAMSTPWNRERLARGGAFTGGSERCRSAAMAASEPTSRSMDMGLRPARRLDP